MVVMCIALAKQGCILPVVDVDSFLTCFRLSRICKSGYSSVLCNPPFLLDYDLTRVITSNRCTLVVPLRIVF
jgi:hypothetical protein